MIWVKKYFRKILRLIWPVPQNLSLQLGGELLTRDEIKTALVVRHELNLAGEQVDSGGGLGFIRVADVQEAVSLHAALPLLPDAPHLALGLLEEVACARVARLLVARLELVQRVPPARGPRPLAAAVHARRRTRHLGKRVAWRGARAHGRLSSHLFVQPLVLRFSSGNANRNI